MDAQVIETKEPANKEALATFEKAMTVLEVGKNWLNKSYLLNLNTYKIQQCNETPLKAGDVRLFQIKRITLENKQSMLESLTATYYALGSYGCTVFLFIECKNKLTDIYLGVKGLSGKGEIGGNIISSAFNGHFTGSQYDKVSFEEKLECLSPSNTYNRSLSSLTTVPSLAIEEREHFMQGLEKFIDAAENENYQALILAEPVSGKLLNEAEAYYANIATQLSPLLKQQLSFADTSSQNIGVSISKAITNSFTQTETTGTNTSIAEGKSIANGKTETEGASHSVGGSISATASVGVPLIATESVSVSSSYNYTTNKSVSISETITDSLTKTTGESHSSSAAKTEGETDTESQNSGSSESQSRTISFDVMNKNIELVCQSVDTHLERIRESKIYGGWQTAAYFIADQNYKTESLASLFLGNMRGKNSHAENAVISSWNNEEQIKPIFNWLQHLTHPHFHSELYQNDITPATLVSGKEMAIQLSLPRRSTSTVAVLEAEAFGRRIQTSNGELEKAEKVVNLGKIRHLWQETAQKVKLDVEKLSGHIFVTGSTGSGKSNTVYQLLNELNRNDVKFMVIEPAKGEYKNVFGHRNDVNVFGTNPKKTALLRINPFKFPDEVHVLEHIDRLVEIFNVCWPMYSAMPAILKDAMLEAYKASGWNLDNSYNPYNIFPTFADLLAQLEEVIKKSDFSQEVKSNYQGSLITRVKSLTNGLNGQIFSYNEVDNNLLFNENVIVDLSRVGSQETKSLIMGILVMRLSEHRQNENCGMNQKLKHVTVLEEAHNILKRTSTEQSSEGANVAGKAVEMLSNAIAEMRTYGEGFIIADQSPSAVDISAIRNTNTKIIMRLPDEEDRRLAGKAAGVTDEQLEEITRLPKGIAVVYQNDWLEPILCQVAKADISENEYILSEKVIAKDEFKVLLAEFLFSKKTEKIKELNLVKIKKEVKKSNLRAKYKIWLLETLKQVETNNKTKLLELSDLELCAQYKLYTNESIEYIKYNVSQRLCDYLCAIKG